LPRFLPKPPKPGRINVGAARATVVGSTVAGLIEELVRDRTAVDSVEGLATIVGSTVAGLIEELVRDGTAVDSVEGLVVEDTGIGLVSVSSSESTTEGGDGGGVSGTATDGKFVPGARFVTTVGELVAVEGLNRVLGLIEPGSPKLNSVGAEGLNTGLGLIELGSPTVKSVGGEEFTGDCVRDGDETDDGVCVGHPTLNSAGGDEFTGNCIRAGDEVDGGASVGHPKLNSAGGDEFTGSCIRAGDEIDDGACVGHPTLNSAGGDEFAGNGIRDDGEIDDRTCVGSLVGHLVGHCVGNIVGAAEGDPVGATVVLIVFTAEGIGVITRVGTELGHGEPVGDNVGFDVGSPGKLVHVVLHKVYPDASSGREKSQELGAPPLAMMSPLLSNGLTAYCVWRTSHRISSDQRPPGMVAW
jgi:hypothetical protein